MNCVCSSNDGSYIAVGFDDPKIRIYNSKEGFECEKILQEQYSISLCFSHDDKILVSGGFDGATRELEMD